MAPMRPKRPCAVPYCVRYALPGRNRCEEHDREYMREKNREVDARRTNQEDRRMYHTRRWAQMREAQLRHDPLCAICAKAGKITIATHVDHIEPHKGDQQLFYDTKNLQSLCASCHSRKTVEEDGGYGRPLRRG